MSSTSFMITASSSPAFSPSSALLTSPSGTLALGESFAHCSRSPENVSATAEPIWEGETCRGASLKRRRPDWGAVAWRTTHQGTEREPLTIPLSL